MRKRFYTPLQHCALSLAPAADSDGESPAPVPVIHNIVSTAQIDSTQMPMDLQAISEVLPGSSYDRRKFAAMTIRLANPSCTLLLFSSGKLVVTGGKNWYEGVLSCLRIARFLQRALVGVDFWLKSCNVQVKTYIKQGRAGRARMSFRIYKGFYMIEANGSLYKMPVNTKNPVASQLVSRSLDEILDESMELHCVKPWKPQSQPADPTQVRFKGLQEFYAMFKHSPPTPFGLPYYKSISVVSREIGARHSKTFRGCLVYLQQKVRRWAARRKWTREAKKIAGEVLRLRLGEDALSLVLDRL